MSRRSVVVAVALAATTTGCGLGPGDSSPGTATLTVTRDYGADPVLEASESEPSESETVIRFLDREAEITTRYGGGFVQSIDGTAGGVEGGRSNDWFFFVNGIESPRGSAEVAVRGGDRIWWDYRDWTAAISTPAVVGSWPEPFLQASAEPANRLAVSVGCLGPSAVCDDVSGALSSAGVEARVRPGEVATPGCACSSAPGRACAPTPACGSSPRRPPPAASSRASSRPAAAGGSPCSTAREPRRGRSARAPASLPARGMDPGR